MAATRTGFYNQTNEPNSVLVAGVIYLLMNKSYHISRNVRAQWFLQHLNSTISLTPSNDLPARDTELLVVSVIPQDPPESWSVESRHKYRYLVTTSSSVIFFSEIYSTVYCLDMSPSISAVDIQHGEVMLDEIVQVVSDSLNAVVSPLKIPGSAITFEPQIFVTVIVHTPFFTTPAQQVLVQGWQVTTENISEFLAAIRKQLQLLEDTIAEVSVLAYDQLDALRIHQMESDKLVGGLFEESNEKQVQMSSSEIPMVSPDSGFINLLRYGMLALRLLPHSSLSNLVVVTDGVISLPDIHVLDLVLTQLRTNAVAVSFLHVGSQFHPHCAQGLVPYTELMQFIACATFGTYIPLSSSTSVDNTEFNSYHEAFLTWSYKKGANVQELSTPIPPVGEWFVSNQSFYGNREPQLLLKKQTEDSLNASLPSVLCCRLHEGFMIKGVSVKEGRLEINLVLPWSNHIYIEYVLSSEWPITIQGSVYFSISIRAPYEFLHDITCLMKKQFNSPYRQAVVSRFWVNVKTLAQSDLLLAHLDSFSSSSLSYTLPESIRNGMPLFYLPSNNGLPALSSSDPSCPQFAQFWRPVCLLDPSVLHKWMHTHTLSILLQHDLPLPKYLHMASPNGRFQGLLCRHAASTLYNFFKDWTSFVLIENHSYLKFLSSSDSDKTPSWFYIVRVQQKSPCAVIHVAFLGGTPGKLRNQIIEQLKEKISALTVPQRLSSKESGSLRNQQGEDFDSQSRSNVPCCIILNKPLEKILIRYERMPSEFGTVIFPDGTQPQTAVKPPRSTSSLVTTLSRYLHHRRWVWCVSNQNHNLPVASVSQILAQLTLMRLQEGFRFAHSTVGIINMVLEVQMKCCDQDADHMCDNCRPSIIQYVLFPIHYTSQPGKESTSEEDDTEGSDSEYNMELIAECWIEPQHGIVAKGPPQRAYMENLPYHQLADVMWRMDAECISKMLTFEYLQAMCLYSHISAPLRMDPFEAQPRNPLENWPHATALSDQRIQKIPFVYNITCILPESQQVELLFPFFIQDLGGDWMLNNPNDAPNVLLLDTLTQQLKTFHDRELFLSPIESKQFVDFIFKRQRNIHQHPYPFPRRDSCDSSSTSSVRKLLDKDSKETSFEEQLGTRASLSLSASNNSLSPKSKPSLGTPDGVRKSCGPLYRMYTKAPPHTASMRDADVERDMPKWRVFIKRLSGSNLILTFVPASYIDCKTIMMGAEPKACNILCESNSLSNSIQGEVPQIQQTEGEKQLVLGSKLNPEAKPFLPVSSIKDSMHSVLSSNSPVSSRGWILDNLDSTSTVFDPLTSTFNSQSNSNWDINKGNVEPSSPFRLRARSWEPTKPQSIAKSKKHSSPRERTRSVGSKGKTWDSKLRKKLLYGSDAASVVSSNLPATLGSINVPIYVYTCSIDSMMDASVLKSEYVQEFKDLFWSRTPGRNSDGDILEDIDEVPSQYHQENTHINQDILLRHHVISITQAFTKSFGVSLFKSLHSGYTINAINVQTVMDECEETLVEINITEYLKTVCRHLRELNEQILKPLEGHSGLVCLAVFTNSATCQEYKHLHKLIKTKFQQILMSCFKQIPNNPDYYFCSPNWGRVQQVNLNATLNRVGDSRNLDVGDDIDSTFQTESVEFRSDQGSVQGVNSSWEGLCSVTTPEEVHTSLLSNMDSDSVSIFPDDELDEDDSPLFLQLICTVQSNSNMGNCSIRTLPTCLGELADCLSFPDGCIDLNSLSVTLDILCLSLPQPSNSLPAMLSNPLANQSLNASGSIEEQFPIGSSVKDILHDLPDYQNKAITLCVEEVKWLMQDEIAAFLLDRTPVTESSLQLVAQHVECSVGRSSCVYQTIPLHFVFGNKHSLEAFLQEFALIGVAGYCLKKENDYYYLVKDGSNCSSQDSTSLIFPCDSPRRTSCTGEEIKLPGSPSENSETRVEQEQKGTTGWSSIVEWHAEVTQLMATGAVPFEDIREGPLEDQCDWLNDLELKRPELPNFWLIMKVDQESVSLYFHCRFLELEIKEVKCYSLVQKNIVSSIERVCKTVNQKMLLQNLHDTRMCNQLLEPEMPEDIWKPGSSLSQPPQVKDDDELTSNEAETPVEYLEATLKFLPGWFRCPVVWETHFNLHPRLKTGAVKPSTISRGMQALRTVLNRFSVNNRKNMFVYQDHSGNVFYLRLYEHSKLISKSADYDDNSQDSVSRSSSVTSLNNTWSKKLEDSSSSISIASKELRPRVKSFGETSEINRQEEILTLKVHGISEAGPEVKSELIQVLDNRLDDAVLDILSVMLARNPMCKLSPEDVHFIQRPNHLPESTVQFSLPSDVLDNLHPLYYYLRQNLMQFLHLPKYTDARPQYHFKDYSHPEDVSKQVSESCIFLYNQSTASGNKGIACIALALLGCKGELIENLTNELPNTSSFLAGPFTANHFNVLTASNSCSSHTSDVLVRVGFRIWKQGRVNVESLSLKLKAAVRHALWDFTTEVKLLTAPLHQISLSKNETNTSQDEMDSNEPLNTVYQNIISPWMQFGYKLGAPAASTNVIVLSQRHPVNVTLREIANMVSTDGSSSFVFYQRGSLYLPYTWSCLPPSTACLLIGRNTEQWSASLMPNFKQSLEKMEPSAQKVLQKFSPIMMLPGSPTFFVPRQRFLIAIVNQEKVILHLYNWAKDVGDKLVKQLMVLGQWLSARSNLQIGIIQQKMGLFLNQPMTRKNEGQTGNPFMSQTGDVENLVSFNGSSRNLRQNSVTPQQLQEVLRDTKPLSKRTLSSDHVVTSVQQTLDTKNQEKRGHQTKLYTMWQTRGAIPSIPVSEDVLDLFLIHSRNIHYCVTPLLFLPRWRIQCASTRDFSLKAHKILTQAVPQDTEDSEERWHQHLCMDFLNEYKQYLQSLGFVPIQIIPVSPKKGSRTLKNTSKSGKAVCYLQKSLLGGVILFELTMFEPFFHSKIHAVECSRLEGGKVTSGLISQFTQSFLDECDRIKVLMHLHSFTYDYHLRTLTRFISGQKSVLKPGYHITSFLDEFIKYYSKAPNYAYSLVHSENVEMEHVSCPTQMLISYMLSNERRYPMKVLYMTPAGQDLTDKPPSSSGECVLVQQNSSSQVYYKDIQDNKQLYEYEVISLVTSLESVDQNILRLRYFILLTSRREPYAKLENEKKLGKFCTVSTANPLTSVQLHELTPPIQEENQDELSNSQMNQLLSPQEFEIKSESVNYLGYYTSHEQFMQQLILDHAQTSTRTIEKMFSQLSLHCRTQYLWNKLATPILVGLPPTYSEFSEILVLGRIEALSDIDPRVAPILAQPLSWYQGLLRLLMAKYIDHHRLFISSDASIQYFVILHPRISDAFVNISLNQQAMRGEMNVVSCQTLGKAYIPSTLLPGFIEDLVNTTCFHLWSELLQG